MKLAINRLGTIRVNEQLKNFENDPFIKRQRKLNRVLQEENDIDYEHIKVFEKGRIEVVEVETSNSKIEAKLFSANLDIYKYLLEQKKKIDNKLSKLKKYDKPSNVEDFDDNDKFWN